MSNQFISFFKSHGKLSLVVIGVALLLEVISAVQYLYTRNIMRDELEDLMGKEITMKAMLVKGMLNYTEGVLNSHADAICDDLVQPDSIYAHLAWGLRLCPVITRTEITCMSRGPIATKICPTQCFMGNWAVRSMTIQNWTFIIKPCLRTLPTGLSHILIIVGPKAWLLPMPFPFMTARARWRVWQVWTCRSAG